MDFVNTFAEMFYRELYNLMKGRDFDEDSRKGSQPKLPNINNVPKYDSPFAIPDDAEV